MNDKFDEMTRAVVQSVTRRGALKKFGVGLAGMALASFGLVSQAQAGHRCHCKTPPYYACDPLDQICQMNCSSLCGADPPHL